MIVVLPLKFMPLGCTRVTLRSETLLYISTPQWKVLLDHSEGWLSGFGGMECVFVGWKVHLGHGVLYLGTP